MTYREEAQKRIKILIDDRGSATTLSKETGVSKACISLYATGKAVPSYASAEKLGAPYRINPAWIMGLDAERRRR